MLQIFPLVAILSAEFLIRVKQKYVRVYHILLALIAATFLHNLPVMITRYVFVG